MFATTPVKRQDGWAVASLEEAHFDAQGISELTRWIAESYEYHNTHAVLIAHAGRLVYELYLQGEDERWGEPLGHTTFNVDSLHDLQSVSKSVTSLLVGLALRGNYKRALQTPIRDFFTDRTIDYGRGTGEITLQHVLTMMAGLQWDPRAHPYTDPRNDNHQLYKLAENPVAHMFERDVVDPPGSNWKYNNGLTEILAAVIEQESGKTLVEFATESLFAPLGITAFEWLGQPQWKPEGRPSAAGGLRLRARDLAKIGTLVLNHGVWNNQQIVPAEWIQLSVRRYAERVFWWSEGVYGYGFQWWPGRSRSIPSYEIISGFGNGGQQLHIVPEHHLVVTIFAGNYGRNGQSLFNRMLGRIVPAHLEHS